MLTRGTPSLYRHDAEAVSVTQELIKLAHRPLSVGRFSAAVCLFDPLGHLLTDADTTDALGPVNRSLKRFGLPGREVDRVSENELDVGSHTATFSFAALRQASDGRSGCSERSTAILPSFARILDCCGKVQG